MFEHPARLHDVHMQRMYPCCNFSSLDLNWVDLWTDPQYSVWIDPKNHKYTHGMVFADADPVEYTPVRSEM